MSDSSAKLFGSSKKKVVDAIEQASFNTRQIATGAGTSQATSKFKLNENSNEIL